MQNNIQSLCLLIVMAIPSNMIYASFSVFDTLYLKTDAVLTETSEEYHFRMQKLGFDIDVCNCDSCRANIPFTDSVINRDVSKWYATKWYASWWMILISLGIFILLILFFVYANAWYQAFNSYDIG